MIMVFSRDPEVMIRVLKALNLNFAEKVAKENFHSWAEFERAAWKKTRSPMPHKCGGKPTQAFEVITLSLILLAASRDVC